MIKLLKPAAGAFMIIIALAGLLYWENDGRERWTMEEIAVASQDIKAGEKLAEDMFRPARMRKEDLIKGALRINEISSVNGRIANRPIEKKSQISDKFMDRSEMHIEKGKSIFVIKNMWIDMRSSSLRGGDRIRVYSDNADRFFGTYRTAFVKDDNEQEVVEAEGFAPSDNIMKRKMSSRPANHVEIIASLEEYMKIRNFTEGEGRKLMLIQEADIR